MRYFYVVVILFHKKQKTDAQSNYWHINRKALMEKGCQVFQRIYGLALPDLLTSKPLPKHSVSTAG